MKKKKLIKAAKRLKKNCEKNNCENCIFSIHDDYYNDYRCFLQSNPQYWYVGYKLERRCKE